MSIRPLRTFFTIGAFALGAAALGCGDSNDGSNRLASFNLQGAATTTAGGAYSLEVDAISGAGDTFHAYAGTVTFESDDPKAILPAPYTYGTGDSGAHTFTVTFKSAGPHTIRAIDAATQGSRLLTIGAAAAKNLVAVSGAGQGGPAGKPLPQKLVVKVSDEFDNAVAGAAIVWAAIEGGGAVNATGSSTDAGGLASMDATLGALGRNRFTASGASRSVTFDAFGMHGDVKTLTLQSGDGQFGTAGKPLIEPLGVKAADDLGAPYPGVTISWSATTGGGTFSPDVSTTGADGVAIITPTLGKTVGENKFAAKGTSLFGTGQNLPTLEFHATGVAGAPAKLAITSGDAQLGIGGSALPKPLVVRVADEFDNGVSGRSIAWSVASGGGALTPPSIATDASGSATASATLGASEMANTFTASAQGLASVTFTANRSPYKLAYTDPPASKGKLRLVRNGASTDSVIVLDLVVGSAALTGYSAGMNLPIDVSKATLDSATPMLLPSAPSLNPGSAPSAALATMPATGPLAGHIVSALSQKADGAGAVPTDTPLPAGTVLYSLKLNLVASGTPGAVFDGGAAGWVLPSGGLVDKAGNVIAGKTDVAIGKLVVAK